MNINSFIEKLEKVEKVEMKTRLFLDCKYPKIISIESPKNFSNFSTFSIKD